MNDRYLYRAKRTDNGEWVEGNLVYSEDSVDDYETIIIPIINSNMFITGDSSVDLGFENWYRVDKSTICQCTGLNDKNGKPVFRGDIIKSDDAIGVVKFGKYKNEFHFGYYVDWINHPYLRPELGFWSVKSNVVGNIFDNLELLEDGQ